MVPVVLGSILACDLVAAVTCCAFQPATISEISSSVMGAFYVGFLPSFWVRLRTQASGLPIAAVAAPPFLASLGVPSDLVTQGALVKWWACFTIVCSDVGAYFGGKTLGRNKLSTIGRGAAGRTSPNKTVEGALCGVLASAAVAALGAWRMGWPPTPPSRFVLSGPALGGCFGAVLGLLALIGDLTASMFKRDAGLKDFGALFPGHGGVLDRFDRQRGPYTQARSPPPQGLLPVSTCLPANELTNTPSCVAVISSRGLMCLRS